MAEKRSAHKYRRQPPDKPRPPPAKRKFGRGHSPYSDELAAEICERIAGDEALTWICAEKGISPATVYKWLRAKPDFRAAYDRARADQGDTTADGLWHIRRGLRNKEIDPARAMAEARITFWEASKRNPRKYGVRAASQMEAEHEVRDFSHYTDEELDTLERIHRAARARGSDGGEGETPPDRLY